MGAWHWYKMERLSLSPDSLISIVDPIYTLLTITSSHNYHLHILTIQESCRQNKEDETQW
jgi:hypothetical protein